MKRKNTLVLAIVLMSIGFAAVSTTLFMSGNTDIATKREDFDVYFSDVYIDNVQILKTISKDRKTITYETNELKTKGETSILDYEVTNASKQYDAKVEVNCIPKEDEWIHVEAEQTEEIIEARSKGVGKINVTLKQNPLEEMSITFSCTLKVEAIERESIIVDEIAPTEIQTWEFDYTGSEQEFIVPRSGEYKIELWGAGPGLGGGNGGYTEGTILLERKQKVYIVVGGTSNNSSPGYNGGGAGNRYNASSTNSWCSGGGGATHLSLTNRGILKNYENNQEELLMVAGAGGGGTRGSGNGSAYGGAGGGLIAYNGTGRFYGYGGTQDAGGIRAYNSAANNHAFFGQGSDADPLYSDPKERFFAGGGGGGYYGGSGGSWSVTPSYAGGGGGGSSFISGHVGCKDALILFADTVMIDGLGYKWSDKKEEQVQMPSPDGTLYALGVGHAGNGYAKITYLGY